MFFFFLFIKATALIKYLSFQKQSACCFRLEISLTTDSPNQRNNWYGNPHSQNTLPWPLFSWNGIVCPRNVFYTALKQQGNIIFGTWILAPKGKNSFIPLWKQVVSASNLPPKPQWVIFLFITISALIKYLRFPKETGCLSLLAGELSLEYSLI